MKFIYNDKEFKVDLFKYSQRQKTKSSKPHRELREKLSEKYPNEIIIEEFPLPGTKPKLYADFFLPSKKIVFEIDGSQHYEYNTFFFKNKQQFYKGMSRDRTKQKWCDENDIILIRINYKEWDGTIDE